MITSDNFFIAHKFNSLSILLLAEKSTVGLVLTVKAISTQTLAINS